MISAMLPTTATDEVNARDFIQSIDRGFAVLLAFTADLPRATLAELATATELSRPAVRRILLTLQRLGYVRADGKYWVLTPRVLNIGRGYFSSNPLIETAQPYLLHLAETTHESASLATLDGADVVYVARVPVRRIMSINVAVGTRVPAHATSMGHVLMAWATRPALDGYFAAAELKPYTNRTLTSVPELEAELARVRELGYSIVDQELEAGLLSLSVPVRDQTGAVVAAVASSTSTGRSDADHLRSDVLPLLLETARGISAELGYRAN